MKKHGILLIGCALAAFALAGCASSADILPSASPVTSVSPSASPMVSESPAPSTEASGITTLSQAQDVSGQIRDAVEKLSEVDDAVVVATGDSALVGLTFGSQYQAGADSRMESMILARAQSVDQNITKVYVTSDEATVKLIEELYKSLDEGQSLSAVQTQAQEIAAQIPAAQ